MKDETKQPGIRIDKFILRKSNFVRKADIPDEIEIDVKFYAKNRIINDGTTLVTDLTCQAEGTNSCIKAEIAYVGIFSVKDNDQNMSLEEFSKYNAPAMIVAFIREELSNKCMKAGIDDIELLPPVNLKAILIEDGESEKKVSRKKKSSK